MTIATPLRLVLALAVAGCASGPSPQELDQQSEAMMRASFRTEGIAKADRIEQDESNEACSRSAGKGLGAEVAVRLMEASSKTIKAPSDGQFLGDWKRGEALAQSGRGMTWTDDDKTVNGGNCYNCHQISKAEISYGTIGPSLYQYGKLRGVSDPKSEAARPMVEYTWGKMWNARATNACSNMPRFGHKGLLNEAQLRDIMALLLDPASPVNAQ